MLVSRVVSWKRAATWLSINGASGDLGDGLVRAASMSFMPARMRLLEEANGILTLVGNHVIVSHVWVACVSQIHTL